MSFVSLTPISSITVPSTVKIWPTLNVNMAYDISQQIDNTVVNFFTVQAHVLSYNSVSDIVANLHHTVKLYGHLDGEFNVVFQCCRNGCKFNDINLHELTPVHSVVADVVTTIESIREVLEL